MHASFGLFCVVSASKQHQAVAVSVCVCVWIEFGDGRLLNTPAIIFIKIWFKNQLLNDLPNFNAHVLYTYEYIYV